MEKTVKYTKIYHLLFYFVCYWDIMINISKCVSCILNPTLCIASFSEPLGQNRTLKTVILVRTGNTQYTAKPTNRQTPRMEPVTMQDFVFVYGFSMEVNFKFNTIFKNQKIKKIHLRAVINHSGMKMVVFFIQKLLKMYEFMFCVQPEEENMVNILSSKGYVREKRINSRVE